MGGRVAFNRRLGAAFCRPGSEDGGRVSLGDSGVLYTDIKRAAQVLRSLGYRSGSPDGSHKSGYAGSIAYDADGVKISGGNYKCDRAAAEKRQSNRKIKTSSAVSDGWASTPDALSEKK